MGAQGMAPGHWVDRKRGLVSREIFVAEEVFRLELERIFARVWLFLAHDSELPNAGDFVTRTMADSPVIVIRGDDGSVKALLNTCRHRGSKVCRIDSGNAKRFACPYHGWTYDGDGRLLNTTFNQLFPEGTDFAAWGLIPVPRVETYKGLIFASWNPDVEPLTDYLGDYRWYLDIFFARTPGGMEVLGPPQRFRVKANWKTAAINFGTDNQHPYTTHIGPFTLQKGPVPRPDMVKAIQASIQIATRNGHTVTIMSSDFHGPYTCFLPEMVPLYKETLTPAQQSVASGAAITVGTVFPNLSFIERYVVSDEPRSGTTTMLRLWQPLGAGEMEIVSWCLAERETSVAFKERSLADAIRNFGISGIFEQEDVEIWSGIAASSAGSVARAYPFNFQTALPLLDRPLDNYPGPGDAYRPVAPEITQFRFLLHWNALMDGTR
jgi:PAH dioxygenase large subunit